MTELKTLKDIENHAFSYDNTDGEDHPEQDHRFYKCCDIRLEAIKWIKTDDWAFWEEIMMSLDEGDVNDIYMAKAILKHFFNITEDELK